MSWNFLFYHYLNILCISIIHGTLFYTMRTNFYNSPNAKSDSQSSQIRSYLLIMGIPCFGESSCFDAILSFILVSLLF